MIMRLRSGPDPNFPYLTEHDRYGFPPPEESPDWIVAVGGNLSPGMLLSAYEQGIFPWYNQDDPLLWQSPDPRFVIFPEKLHVSKSMEKVFKKGEFEFALDRDFPGVVRGCREVYRPGQGGTWITGDILAAYGELHRLGWAHSAESYMEGKLVGGCYGVRLGNAFIGESMFARQPNASKAAFLRLARILFDDGVSFIDCQVHTDHLESLGGQEISRKEYLRLLGEALSLRNAGNLDAQDRRGNWWRLYGAPAEG
ncbi:leucyltransferase [Treponema primitia ZAS-2]|uniref:Leucyl/phenylalanyl-tRNA--protein transferase n=1 Tax=Treponema primitia (strain ATCC BAA-887 / DSM 12427 / ZAS-2) TaxID=545694 RepID=F5YPX6_TREPZ|nr:leucyl/phenylalanyl-tRNA--protein transferase [Treponema primitia]AEF84563.1 leucyltransferase [Treponema primitia ZAS-2]